MKKQIVKIALVTIIAGSVIMACETPKEKVEIAKENVIEAKENATQAEENVVQASKELNQATNDSLRDFREKSGARIADYEKTILVLKSKIAKEKYADRVLYEKKLAILEQKNKDLKIKLADFKANNHQKWMSFKTEFNSDMYELGESFKNLVTKNNN